MSLLGACWAHRWLRACSWARRWRWHGTGEHGQHPSDIPVHSTSPSPCGFPQQSLPWDAACPAAGKERLLPERLVTCRTGLGSVWCCRRTARPRAGTESPTGCGHGAAEAPCSQALLLLAAGCQVVLGRARYTLKQLLGRLQLLVATGLRGVGALLQERRHRSQPVGSWCWDFVRGRCLHSLPALLCLQRSLLDCPSPGVPVGPDGAGT